MRLSAGLQATPDNSNTLAKPPRRLDRQAFADRAERVALDHLRGRHALDDRAPHMGQLHGAAGQEHRVDVIGGEPRLFETDLDPRPDARRQLLGVADEIGPADRSAQARLDP